MSLTRSTRAKLAWLRSLAKRQFEFRDYPVDYVDQGEPWRAPQVDPKYRWRADLLGAFHLGGLGPTPEIALENARRKFQEARSRGDKLPRPGSKPKVVFAATDEVSRFPELLDHFIHEVLKFEWACVSDESTLWDFHGELDNSALFGKVEEVYGVDVSRLGSVRLAAILDCIMSEIGTFPEPPEHKKRRMNPQASA